MLLGVGSEVVSVSLGAGFEAVGVVSVGVGFEVVVSVGVGSGVMAGVSGLAVAGCLSWGILASLFDTLCFSLWAIMMRASHESNPLFDKTTARMANLTAISLNGIGKSKNDIATRQQQAIQTIEAILRPIISTELFLYFKQDAMKKVESIIMRETR